MRVATSFSQRRLWFLDQLQPGSSAYSETIGWCCDGPLDIVALRLAVGGLVARHETLRTTFAAVDGEPVQVIAPVLAVPVEVEPLVVREGEAREAAITRWAGAVAAEPFDLERGPLLRVKVLRLSDDEHALVLVIHHIVSDGWSLGVLQRELAALYGAAVRGEELALAELPIQYADYAVWQRQRLQGAVLERELGYWRERLAGLTPLELPTDRVRPAVASYRGGVERFVLGAELTAGLQQLARREGVTLYMVLLAALAVLLGRYSGQDDIAIGSPIAGRTRPELEGLIGFFVNTLVLRVDLRGEPTFRELLQRVREVALGAYEHQELPFEKLVGELAPERDLSRNPLVDVMLNLVPPLEKPLELTGLEVEDLEPEHALAKFTMTIYVRPTADRLELELVYQSDLFDRGRMVCLLYQYRHLLEQAVAVPTARVSAYSLVTPETRAHLPDPALALDEPPQTTAIRQFEACVRQSPDGVAVEQGNSRWTYADLARMSARIAVALRSSGAVRGDVVALTGPRSFGLIAAFVGVLAAGCVILPVDPALPEQRKRLMLSESGAKHVVAVRAQDEGAAQASDPRSLPVLCIDVCGALLSASQPSAAVDAAGGPEPGDPAYIFFTSGSTGVPKAVLGRHKSLAHFLDWQRQTFAIGPADRIAQMTSLSFDVVLRDVFLPLTSGGTLCLPQQHDEADLPRWLERVGATVVHTVPSVAQSWLAQSPKIAARPRLRWLFLAGEPLSGALVRGWRACFPNTLHIVNLYGPTETTLVRCFHEVGLEPDPGIQPVGRPLWQTQALVLSPRDRLCGVGEIGEIVIRTPFGTLGYLNARAENAQRFLPNPFTQDSTDIVYRTGDLGRYRPDGVLEILGRVDDQVKIRGVRVEPAEVAAVLETHEQIGACAVVARSGPEDRPELVAYVVARPAGGCSSAEIRSFLSERLPPAFIPAAFVFLQRLPLLPTGKVDRKALPEPDWSDHGKIQPFVAPRTPVEQALARIWSDVLGMPTVGIQDDFFELGGHSLRATQVISRVRAAFGVDVPLRAIFQRPTVRDLATLICEFLPADTRTAVS